VNLEQLKHSKKEEITSIKTTFDGQIQWQDRQLFSAA
jgi:hypothetical protein